MHQADANNPNPARPYTELWMGTQLSAPSSLLAAANGLLRDWLARNPTVSACWGGDLPFLTMAMLSTSTPFTMVTLSVSVPFPTITLNLTQMPREEQASASVPPACCTRSTARRSFTLVLLPRRCRHDWRCTSRNREQRQGCCWRRPRG
uniref:Uncharacterized protein n=1 Tax=Oryza barthii TaxID=65489 RepID=A0A0D3F8T2_9ORYZ